MRLVVPPDLLTRAEPLIGVPWVAKGTTPEGWDCLGLAAWCFRQWCGVDVPSYQAAYSAAMLTEPTARTARAEALAAGLTHWREVEPQAGVLARLRWMGRTGHVGFMLGPSQVLHCDTLVGTSVLDLDRAGAPYQLAGCVVPANVTEIVRG